MVKITLIGEKSEQIFPSSEPNWHGIDHELLNIDFEPKIDPHKIAGRPNSIWRYRESIPIENDKNIVSFQEGLTPLLPLQIGKGKKVLVKQDYLFPTGSYKDRGASVLLSKIKELNIRHIVQDSSGNAGASVAAYGKLAQIPCNIYLPADTSESKITQIAAYGAKIIRVNGDRKATANQAFEAAKSSYYASHCFNPYFFQGTKTFAYEVCEQLNWQAPQALVLPAGNGTLIIGCYIGFKELANMGIITKIPKIIAVQSEQCQPLHHAMLDSTFNKENYSPNDTIAEGIAIPNPIRLQQMVNIIKETNGQVITVSEDEICEAWKQVANLGFYIEPTSAATIAGIIKYKNQNDADTEIVSLFSGNGLKSTEKIAKIINAEPK